MAKNPFLFPRFTVCSSRGRLLWLQIRGCRQENQNKIRDDVEPQHPKNWADRQTTLLMTISASIHGNCEH